MKTLVVLIISLLLAYAGIMSYFYFDAFSRNRQLTASLDDAQSLKRKLQDEINQNSSQYEVLQRENERLKKESLEYLRREAEINEKRQEVEKILKQQSQELKQRQEALQKAQEELNKLKNNNLILADINDLARNVQVKKQEEKIASLQKELKGFEDNAIKQRAFMHYNLGVSYTKDRNYNSAIGEYERALLLNSDDPDAHYNLAIIYDDYKRNAVLAIEHYKRYLELKPGAPDIDEVKEWIARLEK